MLESKPGPTPRTPAPPTISAWRIRFVTGAQDGQRIIRRFVDPAPAVAIAETITPDRLSTLPGDSAQADDLYIVHVSAIESAAAQSIHRTLMGSADAAEPSPRVARVPISAGSLSWKPGRVLIESRHAPDESLLAALAQFTHDEWHLRQLEKELQRFESAAPADAQRAYLPSGRNRSEWPRMIDSARDLSLLRLRAARLEPGAYSPPRDLPSASRSVIRRLTARAAIEDRLEAVSARLEACEDLYESAVDRIVEQKGHRLERAIIAILVAETAFILIELAINLSRGLIH